MARRKRPSCFIAMAFNRDDTDLLYKKQIRPVLQRTGIRPVIINQKESNEDLNLQIIKELYKCDFCIADLTYARQSVYFEAGYAQRTSEVIYTARTDHLEGEQPDDRRVHFDLQMKPLITWDDPKDPDFSRRLERRIRATFLKEWDQRMRQSEKDAEAIRAFASLPLAVRLQLLRGDAIKALIQAGYRKWKINDRGRGVYPANSVRKGVWNFAYSTRSLGQTLSVVTVQSYESATKTHLRKLGDLVGPWPMEDLLADRIKDEETVRADHLIFSLRQVPASRIESVFPFLVPVEASIQYSGHQKIRLGDYLQHDHIPYESEWHFLSGVQSRPHLKSLLKNFIENRLPQVE